MTEEDLRQKVRYRKLLEASKAPGATNMDPAIQRFKAVFHGRCLGYYSNLALACSTVDRVMTISTMAELLWSESGVPYTDDYVLDTVRRVYYTRKLKEPYPEGLKVTGAAA
jgi:hypothetical protein